MLNDENKPDERITCEICNGSGYTNNLFALGFKFIGAHISYWMPMLILADNRDKANEIIAQINITLRFYYHDVSNTIPVSVLSTLSNWHFQNNFSTYWRYKFALYNLKTRTVKEVEDKPTIRFNEDLKFRPTNIALLPRTIEYASQKNIYPIRVINGDPSFDPPEFLILICKRRLDLKRLFNK